MKKILTILLCVIVCFYARSQNIVPEDSLPPLDERFGYIFENVDFSYAHSGIVYGASSTEIHYSYSNQGNLQKLNTWEGRLNFYCR